MLRGDNGSIGRHAGPQLQLIIVHFHHGRVINDVLIGHGRITDLRYISMKLPARKCIDCKVHALAFLHAAHVRFRDHRLNAHLAQVVGDRE